MADETADISNKEQVVVCLRWIDSNLMVHEDFIGLGPVARTTADEIVPVLKVSHTGWPQNFEKKFHDFFLTQTVEK